MTLMNAPLPAHAIAQRDSSAAAPAKLRVRDLNFFYGRFHALKGINLDIPQNRVTALAAQNSWGRQQQGANDTRGKQRSQWLYSHPARPIVFRLRAGSGQAIQNIELLRYRDLARDVSLSSSRRRFHCRRRVRTR